MTDLNPAEMIASVESQAYYPAVAIDPDMTFGGMPTFVCANGHRWASIKPEDGCGTCTRYHKLRLKGRTECERDDCTRLVECSDKAWEAGIRLCQIHWTEEGGYEAGPVCLDEFITVLAQYNPRNRWNGWLQPVSDAWSVNELFTKMGEDGDDYGADHEWREEPDGTIVLVVTERQWKAEADERGEEYEPMVFRPDEDGFYDLGSGLVWSEDTETSATEVLAQQKGEPPQYDNCAEGGHINDDNPGRPICRTCDDDPNVAALYPNKEDA